MVCASHNCMKRFLVALTMLLAACASNDKKIDPNAAPVIKNPYMMDGTTIPVGVIPAATLHDAQRNRDVELSIEYPTKEGPYPVIVFSPEYGGFRSNYVALSAFWAGHGYVVVKLSHADAGATRAALDKIMEERRVAQQQQQNRGRRDRNQQASQPLSGAFRADPSQLWESEQTPQDWQNRVADVRFVIDSLPRLVEQYPEIKDRADITKIGVSGHSYGALTAIMTAEVDPRVKAIEAMSPPGPLPDRSLTPESFNAIRVPALFLTGSRDLGAVQSEDATWRKQAFDLSPAGDKWYVSIQGAGRSAFTGNVGDFGGYQPQTTDAGYPVGRGGPMGGGYGQQAPTQRTNAPVVMGSGGSGTVRTLSLAFFDAYLKNDKAGREYLDKLKSRGDVQMQIK
jgi:dienelactone hydrolase